MGRFGVRSQTQFGCQRGSLETSDSVIGSDKPSLPAAVLKAVRLLALTTASTTPVASSMTKVVAGSPPSPPSFGTATTFMDVVDVDSTREGMKRVVWRADCIVDR
jgi:hypothetical protein